MKIGKCKFFAFFDFFFDLLKGKNFEKYVSFKISNFEKKRFFKIFSISKNRKNAKNLHFPIFIAKKGQMGWSKIGGLTVFYTKPLPIFIAKQGN